MINPGRVFGRLLALPALLAGLLTPSICEATLVGPGDLAFVRYHADGLDNFAVVLLADADMGQFVSFNSSFYNSNTGLFGSDGDHFVWEVTEALQVGTVVTFNRLSVTNPNASAGMILNDEGTGAATSLVMQMQQGGDTIYAYLGADFREPQGFLGAISTESSTIFQAAGLINGDTAIYLPPQGTNIIREGQYVGPRDTETNFDDYRSLIANINGNWERRSVAGTPFTFDTTNFSLDNGASVPESPFVVTLGVLMLLAGLSLGARLRRSDVAVSQ